MGASRTAAAASWIAGTTARTARCVGFGGSPTAATSLSVPSSVSCSAGSAAPWSVCSGTQDCVDCPDDEVCNSNHICGPLCEPETCASAYAGLCGQQLDDSCGGTIDCNCSGGLACSATTPGTTGICKALNNCADYTDGTEGALCSNGASPDFPRGDGYNLTCRCDGSMDFIDSGGNLVNGAQTGTCCQNTNNCDGIHEFDWFDPVMLHDKRRIYELTERLRSARLDLIWSARARVDSLLVSRRGGRVDERFVTALADSGCRRLFIGIESADRRILSGIHKGLDVASVADVIAALRDHGIMVLGFFMIGNPGETRRTVRETIRFAKSLPLDYAQFSMTTMKPHTELEQVHMREATGVDYWREYLLGRAEERALPSPWTELTRGEIESLAKRAYLEFYARPEYIGRFLREIESLEELAKYLRVALQLALRPVARGPRNAPPRRRYLRAALTFVEAALAVGTRETARHQAGFHGPGLRGAVGLALEELRRR